MHRNHLFLLALILLPALALPARGQITLGLNLAGASGAPVQGEFVPDSMGAVGPNHYVELVNNKYTVYQKADGSIAFQSSDTAFWTSNGGVTVSGDSFDGRVVFDHRSGRWFATQIDGRANAHFLFAVSNSADPGAGWSRFRFNILSSGTVEAHWAAFI